MSKLTALALIVALVLPAHAGRDLHRTITVKNGDELLIGGRFAHCDYGFYVLLPAGVYAHTSDGASADHGFAILLPDPGAMRKVGPNEPRVIWVEPAYDSGGLRRLENLLEHDTVGISRRHPDAKFERRAMVIDGIRAGRLKATYLENDMVIVEERVVALRAGIIYTIGLRTTQGGYFEDKRQFERIVSGFRFWQIHYC